MFDLWPNFFDKNRNSNGMNEHHCIYGNCYMQSKREKKCVNIFCALRIHLLRMFSFHIVDIRVVFLYAINVKILGKKYRISHKPGSKCNQNRSNIRRIFLNQANRHLNFPYLSRMKEFHFIYATIIIFQKHLLDFFLHS